MGHKYIIRAKGEAFKKVFTNTDFMEDSKKYGLEITNGTLLQKYLIIGALKIGHTHNGKKWSF